MSGASLGERSKELHNASSQMNEDEFLKRKGFSQLNRCQIESERERQIARSKPIVEAMVNHSEEMPLFHELKLGISNSA